MNDPSVRYNPQSAADEMRANRNIEIKARLQNLDEARRVAEVLATERLGTLRQTDTYFHCREGRLKLREIEGQAAQLIWYVRPDTSDAKCSEYYLIEISDPAALKTALATALDVRTVVRKTREVYLYQNVRIHLDDVESLGRFLEFEAVLQSGDEDAMGRSQIDYLCDQFNIDSSDLLANSYGDMV